MNEDIRRESVYPNIFWFGDACLTRMNETKNFNSIRQLAPIIAHNLRAVDQMSTQLKEVPYAIDDIQNVYFSNWSGAVIINQFTMTNCFAQSQRNTCQKEYMNLLKRRRCSRWCYKWNKSKFKCLSCAAHNLFWCCWSNKKKGKMRRAELKIIFNEDEP